MRDQVGISTPEHLLAALYGMGVDNVLVKLNGPEVPILDGSAAPWVSLVEEAGKVRTRKKQLLFLRDRLVAAGDVEHLVVCDGNAPDADEFAEIISEAVGSASFRRSTIGPVIGAHGGPRMVGLTWLDPA